MNYGSLGGEGSRVSEVAKFLFAKVRACRVNLKLMPVSAASRGSKSARGREEPDYCVHRKTNAR